MKIVKKPGDIKNSRNSDDLNYLISLTAFLSDTLDMIIDAELYRDKFMDDILFINNTLGKIEKKFIYRAPDERDYTSVLKKLKNIYDNMVVILENILRRKYKASDMFEPFIYDLKVLSAQHKNSSNDIKNRISRKHMLLQNDNQISREELELLFIDDQENTDL